LHLAIDAALTGFAVVFDWKLDGVAAEPVRVFEPHCALHG
jgi:hypothetical protein